MIAEPIRSTPYIPKPEYWRIIRKACDRHGALLIFDEIPHALGRDGPDVHLRELRRRPRICSSSARGLGGGRLPPGGPDRPRGARRRREPRPGPTIPTRRAPWPAPRALATIRFIEENGLAEHARKLGERALSRMAAMMERHPLIGDDVRGAGPLSGD